MSRGSDQTEALGGRRTGAAPTAKRAVSLTGAIIDGSIVVTQGDLSLSRSEVRDSAVQRHPKLVDVANGSASITNGSSVAGSISVINGKLRVDRSTVQGKIDITNGRLTMKSVVAERVNATNSETRLDGSRLGGLQCVGQALTIRNRTIVSGSVITDRAERFRIDGSTIKGDLVAHGDFITLGADSDIRQLTIKQRTSQSQLGSAGSLASEARGLGVTVPNAKPTDKPFQTVWIEAGTTLDGLSFDASRCTVFLAANARFNGRTDFPGLTIALQPVDECDTVQLSGATGATQPPDHRYAGPDDSDDNCSNSVELFV